MSDLKNHVKRLHLCYIDPTAKIRTGLFLQHDLISFSLLRILKLKKLLTLFIVSFLPYLFGRFYEPNCKGLKPCFHLHLNQLHFGLGVNITCIAIWLSWLQGSNWANCPCEEFGQPRRDVGQAYYSILYVLATSKCLEDQVRT